jgi:hypothetical protein
MDSVHFKAKFWHHSAMVCEKSYILTSVRKFAVAAGWIIHRGMMEWCMMDDTSSCFLMAETDLPNYSQISGNPPPVGSEPPGITRGLSALLRMIAPCLTPRDPLIIKHPGDNSPPPASFSPLQTLGRPFTVDCVRFSPGTYRLRIKQEK